MKTYSYILYTDHASHNVYMIQLQYGKCICKNDTTHQKCQHSPCKRSHVKAPDNHPSHGNHHALYSFGEAHLSEVAKNKCILR